MAELAQLVLVCKEARVRKEWGPGVRERGHECVTDGCLWNVKIL